MLLPARLAEYHKEELSGTPKPNGVRKQAKEEATRAAKGAHLEVKLLTQANELEIWNYEGNQ